MSIKEYLVGNTIQATWVNSGVTPTAIHVAIYDGDETLVDSATMSSSGNGHYYYDHTIPNTPGFYAMYYEATINGNPFRNQDKYKALLEQVD